MHLQYRSYTETDDCRCGIHLSDYPTKQEEGLDGFFESELVKLPMLLLVLWRDTLAYHDTAVPESNYVRRCCIRVN